jgi:hypothetical protein
MCKENIQHMDKNELIEQVLRLSIEQWNKSFGGTSALDICDKIGVTNEEVMSSMEILVKHGRGTINSNVELYVIKFDKDNPKFEMPTEATITHVFFPDKEILTEHFYASNIVRENYPEYKNRLHQGAHQLQLVLFSDEVLTRYFDHPEIYETDDSLSGGHIWTKSEAPEDRYLYVRHGKRKLKSGRTAVTAIFKDLYTMSAVEQRHWHAYELTEEETETHDPNFSRFVARTYDGAFVEFPSPLKEVTEILGSINEETIGGSIFKRIENDHLRMPVENTEKAFYDCCSELYKLVGPDSINQNVIKHILTEQFGKEKSDMFHSESKRALSPMQLLTLLESELGAGDTFTKSIKSIGKYRIEADHKLTQPLADDSNYVDSFITLCQELIAGGKLFGNAIHEVKNTYRDRDAPHKAPLPHHAAYGSVLRGSADQAESDPGEHKSK